MGYLLRQSTATTIPIGTLIDDTDFKARETSVTYNQAGVDCAIMKNNGTWDAVTITDTGGDNDWVNKGDGVYTLELTATQTDTVGPLKVTYYATGVLPWEDTFFVIEEAVYDALFAASAAGYGTAQTGDSYARIGAAGAGLTALGDTRIANLDATVSSRSTYAGGAVASVTGAVGSVTAGVTVTTNNDKTGYTASTVTDKTGYSLTVTPPTAAEIATAVWGATTRTLSGFGSLVADTATAVWSAVTRSLTDKAGFELTADYNAAKTAATAAAVAALNNLSQAQAQTAATAALSAYDGPTKTELDAAVESIKGVPGKTIQEAYDHSTAPYCVTAETGAIIEVDADA